MNARDADCTVCGDTGELPIAHIDDDGNVTSGGSLPCPFCQPEEDEDA